MGYIITENNNLYQMESTISGELMFDEMVDKNDVKKFFIEERIVKLIEDTIAIDMEFPSKYKVNGVSSNDDTPSFSKWVLEKMQGDYYNALKEKLIDISANNITLKPTCDILIQFFD